jgi:hypothetical protein
MKRLIVVQGKARGGAIVGLWQRRAMPLCAKIRRFMFANF